ncbi:MAG: hemolysin family protein [Caldiserica bacterium]|nr:hemolysin family protein [Caldisericota bacterium]
MTGQLVGLIVLLLLSFLFSMVEYGYVTITPMALEKTGESPALSDRLRARMAASHAMLIGVVVLGNNLANLGASFIFARVVLTLYSRVNPDLLAVASTLVLTVVVVIFAETIPKSIGKAFPEQVTRGTAVLLYPLYLLLYPGARALAAVSGVFTGPLLRRAKHSGYLNDSDDFRYLLKMGQEDGVIDKEEERLIYNIFDYTNTLAYEIMTPFVDVTTVDKDAAISEVIKAINETGHSRLPVMDDDNVVGVIYAKDTLRAMAGGAGPGVKASGVLRQPFFAPDTKKISSLLQEMQRQRIQTAVLFDEYGAVSGLITVEDILEEVFGEIQDEYDKEAAEIENAGADAFLIKGSVSTDKASELFRTELSGEDYDTVAGLMLSEIGRLPRVGDKVERAGIVFTVVNVVGKRISRVRAERLPTAPARSVEDEQS